MKKVIFFVVLFFSSLVLVEFSFAQCGQSPCPQQQQPQRITSYSSSNLSQGENKGITCYIKRGISYSHGMTIYASVWIDGIEEILPSQPITGNHWLTTNWNGFFSGQTDQYGEYLQYKPLKCILYVSQQRAVEVYIL